MTYIHTYHFPHLSSPFFPFPPSPSPAPLSLPSIIVRKSATMKFRPCIDLHSGQVKQIVGSTLSDDKQNALTATQSSVAAENFSTDKPASDYAVMYKDDGLTGGHVIMLGPGNQDAVRCSFCCWQSLLEKPKGGDEKLSLEAFSFPNKRESQNYMLKFPSLKRSVTHLFV